jgi:excisionase family DNA binding protein
VERLVKLELPNAQKAIFDRFWSSFAHNNSCQTMPSWAIVLLNSVCVKRNLQPNGGMQMQEQLAVSIPEAARRLGLSIRTVAMLVSRRELASRKVGRRRIIPVAALEAFLRAPRGNGDSRR